MVNNVDIDQTKNIFHYTSVDFEPSGMSLESTVLHCIIFIGMSIKHLVVWLWLCIHTQKVPF